MALWYKRKGKPLRREGRLYHEDPDQSLGILRRPRKSLSYSALPCIGLPSGLRPSLLRTLCPVCRHHLDSIDIFLLIPSLLFLSNLFLPWTLVSCAPPVGPTRVPLT